MSLPAGILLGQDAYVAEWVKARVDWAHPGHRWGPCVGIGVLDTDGVMIAGVVFNNYSPAYGRVEISVASTRADWLTKPRASLIMNYAFRQLGCRRVSATTPHDDAASVSRFLRKFGFRQEGVIRKGLGKADACIWGLLDSEWRFSRFNLLREVVKRGPQGRTTTAPTGRSARHHRRADGIERRDRAPAKVAQRGQHLGTLRLRDVEPRPQQS